MAKTAKEEIKAGAKADVFAKIGKNGRTATITTNGASKVTEVIRVALEEMVLWVILPAVRLG